MRVAIVHEWLDTVAGSESVTAQLLHLFPNARLFSIVDFVRPGERGFLQGRQPRTTFIQHLPFARRHFRSYLPLMPLAVEQLDLSSYDLILSSSHAFAKGVITGPRQVHICYCHTPIRYAWDLQETYLAGAGIRGVRSWFARAVLHYIRLWDVRTAHGVDEFVANSHYVARRIRKTYGREAVVTRRRAARTAPCAIASVTSSASSTCASCGTPLVTTYDALRRPRLRCPSCQGVHVEAPVRPHLPETDEGLREGAPWNPGLDHSAGDPT